MPRHQVRKGEDLAHVLARYRIAGGSGSVINTPENEALFATRTHAVLYEGDEIEVPEGAPQRFVVQTGRSHTFVVGRVERVLTLRVVDANRPSRIEILQSHWLLWSPGATTHLLLIGLSAASFACETTRVTQCPVGLCQAVRRASRLTPA